MFYVLNKMGPTKLKVTKTFGQQTPSKHHQHSSCRIAMHFMVILNARFKAKRNLQDGPECETNSSKNLISSFTDCLPVLSLLVFFNELSLYKYSLTYTSTPQGLPGTPVTVRPRYEGWQVME